jgi:tRNA1Val (adenine37-N6)-methyltransferase
MTNAFHFKEFSVEQNHSGFKVGTDGCLLGAWAKINNANRVLDIGTGSGVIALMLAQRNTRAKISAIELNTESAEQALSNFKNSKYSDRIEVANINLAAFAQEHNQSFDSIVCNPPFFSQSTPKAVESQNQARHDKSLPLDLLFESSKTLTTEIGLLSVIFPSDRHAELFSTAEKHGWFTLQTEYIKPFPTKTHNRILVCFSKKQVEPIISTWSLYQVQNTYSDRALELLTPFYLTLK